jgi:hypothetical protein
METCYLYKRLNNYYSILHYHLYYNPKHPAVGLCRLETREKQHAAPTYQGAPAGTRQDNNQPTYVLNKTTSTDRVPEVRWAVWITKPPNYLIAGPPGPCLHYFICCRVFTHYNQRET